MVVHDKGGRTTAADSNMITVWCSPADLKCSKGAQPSAKNVGVSHSAKHAAL